MNPKLAARHKGQAGFTLIELVIATSLGLVVLSALTSVVVTTMLADNTARARVEASTQVRSFQAFADDDFVLAKAPAPSGCGSSGNPCTTQDLLLQGSRVPNVIGGVPAPYTVRYAWDAGRQQVTRYTGASSVVIASNVTAYSWFVDRTSAKPTVVVRMTVTIATYNATYSESQTFLFSPRITSP
jgi:prepilin-type N-terminal cleavage/methylation domain-containing protein